MGNSVNLFAAGTEPFGITVDLVCVFAQRNFNTEQSEGARGDTMTLHYIHLYGTELPQSLSRYKVRICSVNKVGTFGGGGALERHV